MMCFDPISYDKAEKARKHSENVQEQLNQAIANIFPATNLIKNGDFSDGTSYWIGAETITVSDNEARFLAHVQYTGLVQPIPLVKGHTYYLKAMIKSTSSNVRLAIRPTISTIAASVPHSGGGAYEELSVIGKIETDTNFPNIAVVDMRASGRDAVFVKNVICLDLTDIFGAGLEPKLSEIDTILNQYPNRWFSGTVSPFVSVKEMYVRPRLLDNSVKEVHLETSVAEKLKQYDVLVKNEITNADFSSGLNGWLTGDGSPTLTVSGDTLRITGTHETLHSAFNVTQLPVDVGKKVYVRALMRITSENADSIGIRATGSMGGDQIVSSVNNPVPNKWYVVSGIVTLGQDYAAILRIFFRARYPSGTSAIGSVLEVKHPIVIDLSKQFGAGLEPSLETLDGIISNLPNQFFPTEANLFDSKYVLSSLTTKETGDVPDPVVMVPGNEIDVRAYNSADLNVSIGWATQVMLHGTTDGVNFERLSVQSLDTGTEFNRIDVPGKYQVNLMGVQAIKYSVVKNGAESPAENISILLSRDKFVKLPKEIPSSQYYPSTLPQVEYTAETRRVTFLTTEGTSYYTDDKRIYKSDDYGTTINEISAGHSAWGNSAIDVPHVIKLDDGRLLVWVYYWEDNMGKMTIWRSDENEENFVRKLSYPYEGNIPSGWRPFAYGGIIVYGEYYVGRTDELCRIKLSRDYGETWETIYTAPVSASGKVWHFHDVTYDPYRSRIWVINGDYGENANVRYSDDFGKTWFELWEEGTSPVQFTTVHPMPDKVLFGTDSPLLRGMYVYKEGASPGKYTLEPLKIWTETPQLGNAISRGYHFWDAGAVYFISREQINANDPGYYVIWGTKDGHNLYRLWTSEALVGGGSLSYLNGPDANGVMMAHFISDGVAKNMKFNAPIWERL